ncbi:MAG: hypothetical protein K6C40_12060 [Thermoguttaceae bacterium]|nr:hypothetical protein [Thermoguttaceae bacterium]
MKNEIQQNIRTGKIVRFGLFVTVLVGLFFVIWGVRLLTHDLPAPPPEPFAPHLNPPAHVNMQKEGEDASQSEPKTVQLNINGETVEGTVVQ